MKFPNLHNWMASCDNSRQCRVTCLLLPVFPMDETPHSLLDRLRQPAEGELALREQDWARFDRLFAPILCGLADRLCPDDDDAGELVSELYIALREKIAGGKYDPTKGRFRDWLMTVAHNKWLDILRRRAVRERGRHDLDCEPAVPDTVREFLDREYQANLYRRALEHIQVEFDAPTWQAFLSLVIDDRAPDEVAREFQLTVRAVYMIKFRVLARLRQEMRGLMD